MNDGDPSPRPGGAATADDPLMRYAKLVATQACLYGMPIVGMYELLDAQVLDPAPPEPFYVTLRLYGPSTAAITDAGYRRPSSAAHGPSRRRRLISCYHVLRPDQPHPPGPCRAMPGAGPDTFPEQLIAR